MGFFDITLQMGHAIQGTPQLVTLKKKISLTMGPEQAKLMYVALAKTLQTYEQQFGPIRTPQKQKPKGEPTPKDEGKK